MENTKEQQFKAFKETKAFNDFASKWMESDRTTGKLLKSTDSEQEQKDFDKTRQAWKKFSRK